MKVLLIIFLIAILFVPTLYVVLFFYACFCYLTGKKTKEDFAQAAKEYDIIKQEKKKRKQAKKLKKNLETIAWWHYWGY